MKKWYALFSQTGSEIYQISKKLGRFPDRIITNKNFDKISTTCNWGLYTEYDKEWEYLPHKPILSDYLIALNNTNKDTIITLHGFLRIIPPEICNSYEIYNGHPGDIIKYPELKGFNPQEKAFKLKLPTSGSVIHKVTPGVDEGPIVAKQEIDIEGLSLDEVYKNLHSNSIELWYNFLCTKLK